MLGPGILGEDEFQRQQAAGVGAVQPVATNLLGPEILRGAPIVRDVGHTPEPVTAITQVIEVPPKEPNRFAGLSVDKVRRALRETPDAFHPLLEAEMERPEDQRRVSVLQAFVEFAQKHEKSPELIAKLEELREHTRTIVLGLEMGEDDESPAGEG